MIRDIQPSILLVGTGHRSSWDNSLVFFTAKSRKEALATIRLANLDLIVIGLDEPHLDVWRMMHEVLNMWPHLRWILASERSTTEEEVLARSLGALLVLQGLPDDSWLMEFATSLSNRGVAKYISPPVTTTDYFPNSV